MERPFLFLVSQKQGEAWGNGDRESDQVLEQMGELANLLIYDLRILCFTNFGFEKGE